MARLAPENAERRLRRHITSIYDTTTGDDMNKVELSLHLEANYPANKLSIAKRKMKGKFDFVHTHLTVGVTEGRMRQCSLCSTRSGISLAAQLLYQRCHAKQWAHRAKFLLIECDQP